MPVEGSTVTRRQLGRWLRELRRAARKTERDVEEANLASRVKLWRLETGKVSVKVGDVRGLCWLYGVDEATTDALVEIARATIGLGWWEEFENAATGIQLYLELEAIAESIATYDAERVPAILQTPDYMLELYLSGDPDADPSAVKQQMKLRLERQEVLTTRTPPLRFTVVLGEGALARQVGGAEVMAEQIRRLQGLTQQHPHIDIRVLPWRAGAHAAMHGGAFNILDFADAADPAVVHFEGHTGARYLERPPELVTYRRVFAQVYQRAVPVSDYRLMRERANWKT